jgi:hypothetical protein
MLLKIRKTLKTHPYKQTSQLKNRQNIGKKPYQEG